MLQWKEIAWLSMYRLCIVNIYMTPHQFSVNGSCQRKMLQWVTLRFNMMNQSKMDVVSIFNKALMLFSIKCQCPLRLKHRVSAQISKEQIHTEPLNKFELSDYLDSLLCKTSFVNIYYVSLLQHFKVHTH